MRPPQSQQSNRPRTPTINVLAVGFPRRRSVPAHPSVMTPSSTWKCNTMFPRYGGLPPTPPLLVLTSLFKMKETMWMSSQNTFFRRVLLILFCHRNHSTSESSLVELQCRIHGVGYWRQFSVARGMIRRCPTHRIHSFTNRECPKWRCKIFFFYEGQVSMWTVTVVSFHHLYSR